MPDVTQPTSEALSTSERDRLRGILPNPPTDTLSPLTNRDVRRLFATLDQALARCEAAVQRDEASAALYSDAQPESDTGG